MRCYSVTMHPDFPSREQALLGTIRSGTESVINCGIFNGKTPHVLLAGDTIQNCTQSAMADKPLYEGMGWDFNEVWVLQSDAAKYSYPTLAGIDQTKQSDITA